MTAIYARPLIPLSLWSGRPDIPFLAIVLLSLTLLARRHPTLSAGVLGVAVAFKPFDWVALPFFLLVLFIRWRTHHSRRDDVCSLPALAVVPPPTIAAVFLASPNPL